MTLFVEQELQDRRPVDSTGLNRSRLNGLCDLQQSLSGPQFESPPSASGEVLRINFQDLSLESITATGHRCIRTARSIEEQPTNSVAVDIVTDGVMLRNGGGGEYRQMAGQASLTRLDKPFSYTWVAPGHLFRVLAPVSALSQHLGPQPIPTGPLAMSPLVPAMTTFLREALTPSRTAHEHRLLGRATLEMTLALVAHTASSASLNWRHLEKPLHTAIEDYIETHLTDPDLTPSTIADAFNVCLRSVHGAFNSTDTTVARFIRDRRITAVADVLRSTGHPDRAADLAQQFGFKSIDPLRRAFTTAYGMTPRAYSNQYHGGNSPTRSNRIQSWSRTQRSG